MRSQLSASPGEGSRVDSAIYEGYRRELFRRIWSELDPLGDE